MVSYPEEREAVRKLLSEPLRNMILFVATYFDDISIIDFDQLVKILINDLPETLINQQPNGAFGMLWEWETNADLLLADCGLVFDLSEKRKTPAYRFERSIRQETLLECFRNSQRLVLLRRHETISRGLFSEAGGYSHGIISGCLALNFEIALINPHHYLTGFCLRMAAYLKDDSQEDWRRKQDYMLWLVSFIRTWEENEALRPYLAQFYKQMMETESRREILGALLTHLCTPERPSNLVRLKAFLEGTASREMSRCFRIIRAILLNYLDQLLLFFEEVDTWTDKVSGQPTKSCAFIKIACTFVFYNGWLEKRGKRSLAVQLLEKVNTPDASISLSLFSRFLFGPPAAEAFRNIYRKLYQENYLQEKLLKADTEEDLQLIWAIVLIHWHGLFQTAGSPGTGVDTEPEKLLATALREALGSQPAGRMNVALEKAITIINQTLKKILDLPPADQKTIADLEAKRSSARTIISLLSTHSTDHGNNR